MDTYPRTELCPCCEQRPVDVVGPGDAWSLCHLCHLALAAEAREYDPIINCGTFDHMAQEYARAAMADPAMSDDAIVDAVLEQRR